MTPELEGLYQRAAQGMRLGLDAMREACTSLGDPQASYPTIHVAGTNGKGSVSAMVEAMARAAGLRTGLYTSPHLCRFAERIRIGGEPVGDAALGAALASALAVHPELSFFEAATLAAFVAFRTAKVDLAVIEVGLGGRLDATNVIARPTATAVTRIALDHTAMLGETLAEIAREKAAIAKAGVPMVIGEVPAEVRAAIDEVATAAGASVRVARPLGGDDDAQVALLGAHQRKNAALARELAQLAGVDARSIAQGLTTVRWPGRLERIDTASGPYLVDAAHNPDGAAALSAYLGSLAAGESGEPPPVMVFGALADKDWGAMLDLLAPFAPTRVYSEPRGRAPAPSVELAQRHPGLALPPGSDVGIALTAARKLAGPHGLVLVCGSLYLVGEARARLLGLSCDPTVAL